MAGTSTEIKNTSAAPASEGGEDLRRTNLVRNMEAAAADLEIRIEAVVGATKIADRGMKEAAEEAETKTAAVKDAAKSATDLSLPLGLCLPLLPPILMRQCSRGILILIVL